MGKAVDIDERLPARMERFKKEQVEVFFDSAHAIDSISNLVTNIICDYRINTTIRLFINTFRERKLIGLLDSLESFKVQGKLEVYLLNLNDNRFWEKKDIATLPWVEPQEVLKLSAKPGFNLVAGSTQLYPIISKLFQS
jgi:folylpolyglutamate synthase/dihydropteroate synthase